MTHQNPTNELAECSVLKKASTSDSPGSEMVFDGKIQNKLLTLILSVTAIVLIALAFATYHSSFRLLDRIIQEKSQDEVEIAVKKIERWIEERRSVVEVLAHIEARNAKVNHVQQSYFSDIAVNFQAKSVYLGIEKNGSLVSSDGWKPPKGWDARERDWYKKAIDSPKSIVTEPYADSSPPHQDIITFAAAVRSEENLFGVIAMDTTTDALRAVMSELQIGKYSRSFLVFDSKISPEEDIVIGSQKYDSPKTELLRDFVTSGATMKIYVDSEYRVFARIPDTKLIVVFHVPVSEIAASLNELQTIFGFGSIAALIVLGIAIASISKLIAKPVLSLAEGARQVAAGNYQYRLPVGTRDELGLVTYRFNHMAEGLEERETIRSAFGRYVSPEAVKEILNGKSQLGGEKKLVTILFCDIRGFTTFAERCDPEELVELLNAYFTRMDSVIRSFGGSINRYLGDGILALFGAPTMLENSALASVEAALGMLEALDEFNQEHQTHFTLGIGIHTGVAIVGNIGSIEHTEYTVIGDVANLSSRIESLTKTYGVPILMSEATAALVHSKLFDTALIDKVRVAGKKESVALFAPYIKNNESLVVLQKSKKIVETYLQGDFAQAAELIKALDSKELTPHLNLLLNRCEGFLECKPESWDGAYTFSTK